MNVLDLFSGIGGFSLGLERAGMKTVAFCEIEEFPRNVLAKHWPNVPIYRDVKELNATRLADDGITGIDVICGGFPCQPFSVAGKQLGDQDHRHLWPEYRRLVEELRPSWVIGENVIGLVRLGLDTVLDDLEALGYSVRTFDIPACGVGAPHERRRVWIVAYAEKLHSNGGNDNSGEQLERVTVSKFGNDGRAQDVADTIGERRQGQGKHVHAVNQAEGRNWKAVNAFNGGFGCEWEVEPGLGRVVDGVPNRAHRLKALGNAVVPQIPEIIGRAIIQAQHE